MPWTGTSSGTSVSTVEDVGHDHPNGDVAVVPRDVRVAAAYVRVAGTERLYSRNTVLHGQHSGQHGYHVHALMLVPASRLARCVLGVPDVDHLPALAPRLRRGGQTGRLSLEREVP